MRSATPPAKPTERGAARRSELLEAAGRLFADRPYDALSIEDIADEVGVAKGLIYYYFGSKRGLYIAVIESAVTFLDQLAEGLDKLRPLERLRGTIDAYLWYASTHEAAFRTITSGGVGVDAEIRGFYDRTRRNLLGVLVGALTGSRTPRPTMRVALEGWLSFVEGATVSWLDDGGMECERLRDLAINVLGGTLDAVLAIDPECQLKVHLS